MLYSGVSQLVVTHLQHEARDRIEPAFPPSSLFSSLSAFSSTIGFGAANGGTSTNKDINGGIPSGGRSSKPDVEQGRIAQSMEGESFLNALKGTWEDHKVCMGKLRDVLKYMVSMWSAFLRIRKS